MQSQFLWAGLLNSSAVPYESSCVCLEVFTLHSLELKSGTVPFGNSWTASRNPSPGLPCTHSHYWGLWEEWHWVMLHKASADSAWAGAEGRCMRSWISEGNSAETLCISLANRNFCFWCRMQKMKPTHKQYCIWFHPCETRSLMQERNCESNFRSSQWFSDYCELESTQSCLEASVQCCQASLWSSMVPFLAYPSVLIHSITLDGRELVVLKCIISFSKCTVSFSCSW